ncbi:MAG: RluA family pseudouridine synthase [Myxococcota bacterium]
MAAMAEPAVRILHRDDQLLVLYKPPGLPTTAPDGGPCLVNEARALDPQAPRVHPTSRLDAETSGVVVFARTRRATRRLLDARRRGAYRRTYVALAGECPGPSAGTWRWSIARDARDPRRRVARPEGEVSGRAVQVARSAYRVVEAAGLGCALHVWPETGRTHQIRVHAAQAGAPLLGDVHYGGPRRRVLSDGTVVTARRVMLHCARVSVPSPGSGVGQAFRARAPEDLVAVWEALGGSVASLEPTD